jgi:hypothetical protein
MNGPTRNEWADPSGRGKHQGLAQAVFGNHHRPMSRPVEVGAAADGTLIYLIHFEPSELPAVRTRDILLAWDLAREAANRAIHGTARAFRFRRADGGWTDLALHQRDAACWAGAVDRAVGMETSYGLAVCLRLLALIDLLARSPWAHDMVDLSREAKLHPTLLRLAAEARLTDEAGFDSYGFQQSLRSHAHIPNGAPRP